MKTRKILVSVIGAVLTAFLFTACPDGPTTEPTSAPISGSTSTAVKPSANPQGGDFITTQTVTLSTNTVGATIYYTIDGSEPTTASSQYTSSIIIEHTTTIKAIAVKTDMDDSDVMTEEYVITPLGQVVQPSANLHSGKYFGNQTITLTNHTEGAVIYYTLNGTEPTTASAKYTSPISISKTTTIKAFAVKASMHDSDVITVDYTIIHFPLTDLNDVALYLDMHTGTVDNPINLPVQMRAQGSGWENLLGVIAEADEFIDLDLSACTMTGTEFNPDGSIVTGKNKIVSIALPDTATSISIAGFALLKELKSFSGKGLKSIGYAAFSDCTNLALTSLPEGLTSIGDYAFYGCTNLALTSLPEGLTSIGDNAFYSCTNLALTSLPEGLTSIGLLAFRDCINLALTSLPTGVTTIGDYAFYGCTNLALTSLPEGIISIGISAFYGCTNLALTSLPAGITSINSQAFYNCSNLALTSLPEGITSIGSYAFSGCGNLALTSLPEGIISIGDFAFQTCRKLTLTSLPEGLISISRGAFNGCANIVLTSLPAGVTTIGINAFTNCTNLALTSLPAGVTTIGDYAFYGCTSLAIVTCLAVTPPIIGIGVFPTHASFRIEVPTGGLEAYKTATNWSAYANRIFAIE